MGNSDAVGDSKDGEGWNTGGLCLQGKCVEPLVVFDSSRFSERAVLLPHIYREGRALRRRPQMRAVAAPWVAPGHRFGTRGKVLNRAIV